MLPETPFAQLFTDIQAGNKLVQWHKNTPVSDEERDKLRTQKRAFGFSLIAFPFILAVMYYFAPHLFYTAETGIERNMVAIMAFGFVFSSGSTLWLIQRINRSLNQPLHTIMPAKYTVRFKAADKQPKGLSVTRGTLIQLNYQDWIEQDWQAVLPPAKPEDQRRLSELIKQKLAAK